MKLHIGDQVVIRKTEKRGVVISHAGNGDFANEQNYYFVYVYSTRAKKCYHARELRVNHEHRI